MPCNRNAQSMVGQCLIERRSSLCLLSSDPGINPLERDKDLLLASRLQLLKYSTRARRRMRHQRFLPCHELQEGRRALHDTRRAIFHAMPAFRQYTISARIQLKKARPVGYTPMRPPIALLPIAMIGIRHVPPLRGSSRSLLLGSPSWAPIDRDYRR